MDINPKISIIIVNYNCKEFLIDCLKSVKNSNYNNFEIILVDNCSCDGSIEIARENFQDIKIIQNKKNLGFAKANNIGIKHATGDAYFLLNPDTIIHPDLIKTLSHELFKQKEIGIVGPKIYYLDKNNNQKENKIWFAGGEIDFKNGLSRHISNGLKDSELKDDFKKQVDFITGCALMVKKEVVEKIGFLEEKFFAYYEDADWCQRAKRAGYEIIYVPFGGVRHIKSAISSRFIFNKKQSKINMAVEYLRNLNRLKYNKYRNYFIFYWRYQPNKYKIKFLINFIFIKTPRFIWSVLFQSQLSLIRTAFKLPLLSSLRKRLSSLRKRLSSLRKQGSCGKLIG